MKNLIVWFFTAEILLHQLFVQFDDLIQDSGVRGGDGKDIAFAAVIEQAFDDGLGFSGGKIDRQTFVAEGFLNLCDEAGEINFGEIDFVDNDGARKVA